jgi:transposase
MNARLAGVSRTIAGGAQAVPVPDGAGWQGAKALKVADTIPLMPLPPYAPDINPVEHLRACLRASRLRHLRLRNLRGHRGTMLRRVEFLRQRHCHPALDSRP